MQQRELFHSKALPPGFEYWPDFLAAAEEAALLETIAELPLAEAEYKEWRAKRRIVSYGGRYDFSRNELLPAGPVPALLEPLRARIARWAAVRPERFEHALIAEYRPGTQLGWHRDVPQFELVAGVSLGGEARMRFRPYPSRRAEPGAAGRGNRRSTMALDLAPRSVYLMRDDARWKWQHAISPTKALRYSITFRTRSV